MFDAPLKKFSYNLLIAPILKNDRKLACSWLKTAKIFYKAMTIADVKIHC